MQNIKFTDLPEPKRVLHLSSVGGDIGEILSFIKRTSLKEMTRGGPCERFSPEIEHAIRQMEPSFGFLLRSATERREESPEMKATCEHTLRLLSLVLEAVAALDIPRDEVLQYVLSHAAELKGVE